MKPFQRRITVILIILITSLSASAQVFEQPVANFHSVLQNLYNEMIPMANDLLNVVRAIAGFGALWYIAVRVWRHLAAAEPIDIFPLLRPFAICLAIGFYPTLLQVLYGLLNPVVIVTESMAKKSHSAVDVLLEQRRQAITNSEEWQGLAGGLGGGNQGDWQKYDQQEEEGGLSIGQALSFSMSIVTSSLGYLIKLWLSELLQLLYYAAALCIDAMRTFHLIVLSILGPFVLCLATYDGLHHTLNIWIARYINVFLWLPITNLFSAMIGKIQQGMLHADLSGMADGHLLSFGQTDMAYLIFLVIAIFGYFSIPSIANYIVHASGANAIVSKTNSMLLKGGAMMVSGGASGAAGGGAASSIGGSMAADSPGNDKQHHSMASAGNSEGYQKDGGSFNYNKVSGNA
jgi:conjugative transposon TraJ protein